MRLASNRTHPLQLDAQMLHGTAPESDVQSPGDNCGQPIRPLAKDPVGNQPGSLVCNRIIDPIEHVIGDLLTSKDLDPSDLIAPLPKPRGRRCSPWFQTVVCASLPWNTAFRRTGSRPESMRRIGVPIGARLPCRFVRPPCSRRLRIADELPPLRLEDQRASTLARHVGHKAMS